MASERLYTVLVEPMAPGAFHLTVRELPATWTVAFAAPEIEARARHRIGLDLHCDPASFEVTLIDAASGLQW